MAKKNETFLELGIAIRRYIQENNLRKIILAISGGADSIAATHFLKSFGIELMCLHCNFHLRGEESNRDQLFVENFCKTQELPLKVRNFNIKEYVSSHPGTSIEMACRDLRYEWFQNIKTEMGFDRIVTAHNADDNIETFFLNLLRGSGTKGLKGIIHDDGTLWRPLLPVHRVEIEKYLSENKLEHITDSSNLKSDYRRNYLRNEVIPLLKKEWEGFDKAMDKTLRYLTAENKIIEMSLENSLPKEGNPLNTETIIAYPDPELLIKRYISDMGPYVATPIEILDAIRAKKPHCPKWILKKGIVQIKKGKLYKNPL